MRNEFSKQLELQFQRQPYVFLTGDLGFSAFEKLSALMGDRFINAGVAEQNMVTMAAGIASEGIPCWAYSIAPFIYARPFEQIRNDVCFHGLPVKLVANGGGFAYGVMGATHHALEDYGILLTLPGMHVFVPCFDEDLERVMSTMATLSGPSYLRLGYDESPTDYLAPSYAPWRKVLDGEGPVVVSVGPIVGSLISHAIDLSVESRPEIWAVSELPLVASTVPSEFWAGLGSHRSLIVVEEHVLQGSLASMLAIEVLRAGISLGSFECAHATHSFGGRSGSQKFYRERNQLDASTVLSLGGSLQVSTWNGIPEVVVGE